MKKQLLKAEKYIFLEYFIIGEGEMWGESSNLETEGSRRGGSSSSV